MEEKNKKYRKACCKKDLNLKTIKKCLKASQIINIVKYLEKKGINVEF